MFDAGVAPEKAYQTRQTALAPYQSYRPDLCKKDLEQIKYNILFLKNYKWVKIFTIQ